MGGSSKWRKNKQDRIGRDNEKKTKSFFGAKKREKKRKKEKTEKRGTWGKKTFNKEKKRKPSGEELLAFCLPIGSYVAHCVLSSYFACHSVVDKKKRASNLRERMHQMAVGVCSTPTQIEQRKIQRFGCPLSLRGGSLGAECWFLSFSSFSFFLFGAIKWINQKEKKRKTKEKKKLSGVLVFTTHDTCCQRYRLFLVFRSFFLFLLLFPMCGFFFFFFFFFSGINEKKTFFFLSCFSFFRFCLQPFLLFLLLLLLLGGYCFLYWCFGYGGDALVFSTR